VRIDESRHEHPPGEKPFLVGVLAPTLDNLPPGRSPASYGTDRRWWRPFGSMRELSLAEYAADAAERRGLPTRLIDSTEGGDIGLLDACPAVLLVDPWMIVAPDGADFLAPLVKHLHQWVTFVVIVDRRDPQHAERGEKLYDEVSTRLGRIGARRVSTVRDVDELARRMPGIVDSTRREYLSSGEVHPPKGTPERRPTLLERRENPSTSRNEER
jgi:FxsC-like protein